MSTPGRLPVLVAGAVALLGLAASCGRADDASARSSSRADTVVIRTTDLLSFDPAVDTIRVGDTVRWENSSVMVHTVTDDPALSRVEGSARLPDGARPFNSGNLDPDATFVRTFTVPGTYGYFCIPHEGAKMKGTLIVLPGG